MQEALLALEEAPLFQSLAADEMAFLRERVHQQAFKPGAHLLERGEDSPGLYVVRSGLVAVVVRDDAGLEREIASLGRGECVGEMALMTGEPPSATVRAMTDVEAWLIKRGDVVGVVDRCPGLWRNLCRILSHRLVQTSRHLAARPSTNMVALIMSYPREEAAALAVAIAASVARHSGRRTLLVDAADGSGRPAAAFAPGEPAPSLWEVLHERSLLRGHEVAPDRANGLWGARVAGLSDKDGRRLSEEESLTALEWLRPLYDYILLLLPGPPAAPWPLLLERARSIVTVVAEEEVDGVLPWLDGVCRSPEAQGKVELAVVAARPPASTFKQAMEKQVARVRWLPEDRDLLQLMLREKAPLSDAHLGSPLSKAIGGLARHIGEMEVGVALGAGAAKGFAHIGVLAVLEENGVPIDYIAGSSIGAIVGACYAGRVPLTEIERLMRGADRKFVRWTLPFTSLWSDAGLKQVVQETAQTYQFQDLAIPFAAIATDLATGREVVLREGLIRRAVQASVSIPGIFPPTVIAGRYLVDGGLVNPVPSQTVRDMGADIVLAVDLMSPAARTEASASAARGTAGPGRRAPNLVEMLWRSNEIMQGEITARSAATADVTIQPKVGRTRFSDFSHRGRSLIAAGEQAAREALPELSRLLPFLTPAQGSGGDGQ